ncbi:MAG: YfhO family protein [Ichthyobacteriaceae bacterium]|nr:YfhO family protein [Ichthyobacteriaceae bacterium]
MNKLKPFVPHFIVVGLFLLISVIYFSPLLSGKKIYQSDGINSRGMAQEIVEFRDEYKQEPYWTNSMFGGMPTYQIASKYKYDLVKSLDSLLRPIPRPADYLLLSFISFYFMMILLGNDWRISLIGALGFGLSTYMFIIVEAGHNSKAHAIAYLPMLTAGIILAFRKKYLLGGIITAIFMALEISANHYQMTYYFGLLILILGGFYIYEAYKNSTFNSFFKSVVVLLAAVVLAFGVNATKLMATIEYTKHTTRGPSELTLGKETAKKSSGLDKDYITQWSYGISETFNLLIPNFMGGASSEELSTDSNLANALKGRVPNGQLNQILKQVPTYWGGQPFTSGPAYIGAIIIFLFVLGIILVDGTLKWWLLTGTIMSLTLAWGKNMMWLTDIMIDYFPMYNKFRAVSSIQIVAEFTMPFLAVLALKEWFFGKKDNTDKFKALKISFIATGGLSLLFFLLGSSMFDFIGLTDSRYAQMGFPMDAIRADRLDMLKSDSLRSLLLISVSAVALYFAMKNKLKENLALAILAILVIFDLGGVNKRYLNNDDFLNARKVDNAFPLSSADAQILKDTSIYRVYNATVSTMNNSTTSYYHQSIGGYHGAKLQRYQDLWDFQLSKQNQQVINMLNTKYIIAPTKEGKSTVVENPNANGNAWFVDSYKLVENANAEMTALSKLNTRADAIIDKRFADNLLNKNLVLDNSAKIKLTHYQANELKYNTENNNDGLAVFSEIYYSGGWNAYIDGNKTEISRANYVLRALWIPKGKHEVVFKFEPQVISTGNKITLASNIILFGLIVVGIFFGVKRKED